MSELGSIGKYEIQAVLGRGAMGVVYRGYDRAIARSVAIKVIARDSIEAAQFEHVTKRFRHEAQAVGRLVHPRIVQIYDYGEDDQNAYIVMELVNGKTLSEHLSQETNYEIREAGEIVRQILDGIGYAHSEGVVHRDLKLSNILINNDGRIKISDFGIARIDSSNLTQVGDVLGTPYCMAPEQFLGQDVDALVDLYAIGVMAYQLLTGVKPFTGNAATVMQRVLNERPADPSTLNPKLSTLMDSVLHKALAKKREERFQSAREFADAFRAAIDASDAMRAEGTHAYPAPDVGALLDAARLLNPAVAARPAVPAEHVLPALDDSAISLDRSIRKARLLIIDDEERILTALKSRFKDRYHVFTTTDSARALDFLTRHLMHVIISDQRMPSMQGVELLRRSREVSPHSVRILLTGYSDLAAIVGSINEGEVYRFVSKPWDNDQLQRIVAEAVTIAMELSGTKGLPPGLPGKLDAGVLVIDSEEEIYRVTRELIGGLCPVYYAGDLDAALQLMHDHEIAVVVTDVEAEHEELTAMLKLLKQENPQILTIVVTRASDADMIVELINQAQLFRFLNKPVNVGLLKKHMHTALRRYLAFMEAPELTREHQVQTLDKVRDSAIGRRILSGTQTLRERWHAMASQRD
jgi:response regulator RpfG family c-di-GMP phosphodiesterase/tRNA A-37 threonylcarbamoyl transferase component Bud32